MAAHWCFAPDLIMMILLPKILYAAQQSPIHLPHTIFGKLNSILNSFVWREGRAKLSWLTMRNTWDYGGMSVPDIQLRTESCCISD